MTVSCPYCHEKANLVSGLVIYPHRNDLADKSFYLCYPCDAYVGIHVRGRLKGKPLGTLANADLRTLRQQTHEAFDPVWQFNNAKRGEAYAWLAEELGIKLEKCHIAMFDEEACRKTIEICRVKERETRS